MRDPATNTRHERFRRELRDLRRSLSSAQRQLDRFEALWNEEIRATDRSDHTNVCGDESPASLMSVRWALPTEASPMGVPEAFVREFGASMHASRRYRREALVHDATRVLAVLGELAYQGRETLDTRLRLTVARGSNGADIRFEPIELIEAGRAERLSRPRRALASLGLPELGTSVSTGAVEAIRGVLLLAAFGRTAAPISLCERARDRARRRGTTTTISRLAEIANGLGIDRECPARQFGLDFADAAVATLGKFLATPRVLPHSTADAAGGLP